MLVQECLRGLFRLARQCAPAGTCRRAPSGRPELEQLEDRIAPHSGGLSTALPLSFANQPVVQVCGNLAAATAVDFYAVTLAPGEQVTIDVNAQRQGSPLDALLRLFDANSTELAANDNTNGLDPLLSYAAVVSGTFYVGISSSTNRAYDPHLATGRADGDPAGPYTLGVFLQRGGGPSPLQGTGFSFPVVPIPGHGISTPGTANGLLAADFPNEGPGWPFGSGQLVQPFGNGRADAISALQALEDSGNAVDLAYRDGEAPAFYVPAANGAAFPPVVTDLARAQAVALATGLPNNDLVLVAILLAGGLLDRPPARSPSGPPSEETFDRLLPPAQARNRDSSAVGDGGVLRGASKEPVEGVPARERAGVPRYQAYLLGADEALRRWAWQQQLSHHFQDLIDCLQGWLNRLAALAEPAGNQPPPVSARPAEANDEDGTDTPANGPGVPAGSGDRVEKASEGESEDEC